MKIIVSIIITVVIDIILIGIILLVNCSLKSVLDAHERIKKAIKKQRNGH